MKNRNMTLGAILSALACFAFLPQMQAAPEVVPPPDGCYPGFTTAEGCNALQFLGAGAGNTGVGWYSLYLAGDSNFNTGVGAGTLVLNTGDSNTAVGAAALLLNTTGTQNVAVGTDALVHNDSGSDNNAVGAFALFENTTGTFNNAHGRSALEANVDGLENNAMGDLAMVVNTSGSRNTAVGDDALFNNTEGDSNVAVGDEAGNAVTTGSENTFVGKSAGAGATDTLSGNIYLGVRAGVGVGDEVAFIRIGETTPPVVYDTFVQGIYQRPAGPAPLPVVCGSNGKLTANASSRRFKHDIKPIEKGTEAILALKPVTFRYNSDDKKNIDNTEALDFGLVAEEVDEVIPDLVIRDKEGKPLSVHYQGVTMMLLSEFIKEHKKVEELQATVAQQQKGMEVLTAQLKEQAARIQKVSAQLEASKPAPQVVNNR